MNEALLHVYGQESEHGDVWIVGNRTALFRLAEAIHDALWKQSSNIEGKGLLKEAMTSDGEGYEVYVVLNDTPWQGEYWKNLALPYTGSASEDHREGAKWPWEGK